MDLGSVNSWIPVYLHHYSSRTGRQYCNNSPSRLNLDHFAVFCKSRYPSDATLTSACEWISGDPSHGAQTCLSLGASRTSSWSIRSGDTPEPPEPSGGEDLLWIFRRSSGSSICQAGPPDLRFREPT